MVFGCAVPIDSALEVYELVWVVVTAGRTERFGVIDGLKSFKLFFALRALVKIDGHEGILNLMALSVKYWYSWEIGL